VPSGGDGRAHLQGRLHVPQKTWATCPEHSTLSYDDSCEIDPGYHRNANGRLEANPPVKNQPPLDGLKPVQGIGEPAPVDVPPGITLDPPVEKPLDDSRSVGGSGVPDAPEYIWKDPGKKPTPFGGQTNK
jgi:hypothetical protein